MQTDQKTSPTEAVNIFSDFTNDSKLQADILKGEEKNKKDFLYYISIINSILKTLNALVFAGIFLFFLYTVAQKSENIDLSLINPICFIFEGSQSNNQTSCTSVSSRIKQVVEKIENTKKDQFEKTAPIVGDIYSLQNFIFSKEITFLVNKSQNRVKPLKVLREFDTLKTKFEPLEKSKLNCSQINILQNNILRITCEAYSSDWDKQIVGFSGDKSQTSVEGTSLSIATSFLNFIDENAKNFSLINRQKIFSTVPVDNVGPYTKKTTFDIEIKFFNDSL